MASRTGLTQYWPPVASFGEGSTSLEQREHLIIPAPARFWSQTGTPTTFAHVAKGDAITGAVCGLNALLTSAMLNKLITVEIERVYLEDIEAWEQRNPGKVPQDEYFLGYYFHLFGALPNLVAFTGELQRLVENAAMARTTANKRDVPPPPGSLVHLTKKKVFQCIFFCQEGAVTNSLRELEAEYHDVPFGEWVTMNEANRQSVLARLHYRTQEACRRGNPLHPFHNVVSWQEMGGAITPESRKRGFVYRLDEGLARELSPFDMSARKQECVIGFDYLFCRQRVFRPEFRPEADVISRNKEMIFVSGDVYQKDRRPAHVQAPQFHINFYHGDPVPGGDERLGRDFPILNHPSTDVKQGQFPSDMFKVIERQYPSQTLLGLKMRKEINALPDEQCTMADIAFIVGKYIPVVRTMLRMSEDDVPQPPDGVVPVLAQVVDFNASQDPSIMPLGAEFGEGCLVHSVINDLLGILLKEYRQYTPRQTLLGYFAAINHLTCLMSTKHGARIIVQGPPESGKSDVCDFVGRLLGPMSMRSDLSTEAASKHPGKGSTNTDCGQTIQDEGNKELTTNQRLLEQTGVEAGFTEVYMMVPHEDGKWTKELVQCMKRGGALLTANEHNLSPAQLSRTMAITMPKVTTSRNQARRAATDEVLLREAVDKVRAVMVGAAGACAAADHLFIRNCPPSRLPTQILGLMLEKARITLTPRQFKRIEDFALGVQTLVLYHLLYRLPTFAGLAEEMKWIIHQCNMQVAFIPVSKAKSLTTFDRYPNPQGLLVGIDLYRSLTGDSEYFANFVAAVKLLIKVKGGITEQDDSFQLDHVKTSKYQNSVDSLLTQVEKAAISCGFNPGKKFLQQALDNANSNPDGLVIVEKEDSWYLSKTVANKYFSFYEETLINALIDFYGPLNGKPNKYTCFPQSAGTYLASPEFMVLPEKDLRESTLDTPAMQAFRKMSPAHIEHAMLTLSKRMVDGRQVFDKISGQVYTVQTSLSEAEYSQLPNKGSRSSKEKAAQHAHFPGVYLIHKSVPYETPYVIHHSLLRKGTGDGDAVGDVAEAFLASFGDFSGTYRMYGIDATTTEPKGVDIDPKKEYKVLVKNPNYREAAPKASKFKSRAHLPTNPLSTGGAVHMAATSQRLTISKASRFSERIFIEQAMSMGMNEAEATAKAALYSLPAMMKKVAEDAALMGNEDDVAPGDNLHGGGMHVAVPEVVLPFNTVSVADSDSDEDAEVGGGTLSPKRTIAGLLATEDEEEVVVRDPPPKKKRGKRRLVRFFVDDEAGASGGSSDEDVQSETSYDRGFLDDEVGSEDDMAGPAPLLESD